MAKVTPMLALLVCLGGLGTLHAQGAVKPIGKWERKIDKRHVTLVVEEHRLHLTVLGTKPCVLHADYSVTKDGIVYGIVTSVECDDPDDEEDARALVDAPFSCRFRIDEGALIIRDLKSQEMGNKDDTWNGRFKAVPATPIRASGTTSSSFVRPSAGALSLPPMPADANRPASSRSANSEAFNFWPSFSR